ncbi:EsaB/YukD family protein [Streptomyces sp. NRRL F-5123]|uniref:EsaB/YukD family protein n=1 Tax=Streptomyces sp. NRRL F-5123 TaxID=1463856 RepID=UPI0004E1544E|nr:EsaB/YukD family protein [Streptomyces sp. NRRL F-5123]
MDEHCRITVVGERRQVDLAVPADAPITTYVESLVRMCGQPQADVMPAAWSLAVAAQEPFAPERSLVQAGVVDGQVLYLRDVTAHEFDEPVVHDVAERVAEVAEGVLERGWTARTRVVSVAAAGMCWLLAVLVVSLLCGRMAHKVVGDLTVTAGLVLPALAWVASERRWPLPWRLREAFALAAVPLLALGAGIVAAAEWDPGAEGPGGALTRGGFVLGALGAGALVGALIAYVAAFGVVTCAVLIAAAVVAGAGTLLALVGADGTQAATVAAVCAFVLLAFGAQTASGVVGHVFRREAARRPAGPENEGEDRVAVAVAAARTLLVAWTWFLTAVAAAALVALAASPSRYGVALAACLGVALLLRAGGGRLAAEVVAVGAAGGAGLCMVLVLGAGRLGWNGWTAPGAACLVAAGLLVYGFRNLMRGSGPLERARPGWPTSAASLLGAAGIALAVAAFGVFGAVLDLGRHL